ncbi:hypothetical protein AB1Y20_012662 [Prymnesium parvum]|uniref:Amino acid transporter transmembrane domain-containing protein n=1 Tax=Prymnesium parvum TaxID=97485 RepID=A0AB34IIJ4_PRYPA
MHLALPALRRAPAPLLFAGGQGGSKVSELQCTVALVKNIVGTGVLTLPVGISRLSESGASSAEALAIASALLLIVGGLNAWGFVLIGEACAATRQGSYVGAWRKTMGPSLAFLPALASLVLCFTASVSCACVIADTATDLLAGALQVEFDALPRNAVLASIAAGVLAPLCLLPSLAPLGSASVFGVSGILITGIAMLTRLADGSYVPGQGAFSDMVQAAPQFTSADSLISPTAGSVALLVSLLSNAFLAHYNAPGVYNELAPAASVDDGRKPKANDPLGRLRSSTAAEQVNAFFQVFIASIPVASLREGLVSSQRLEVVARDRRVPEARVQRALSSFRRVVTTAFGLSALLFLLLATSSFATFGNASADMILNSYASSDPLASVARAGVLLAVLFEFPLLERPFRLTVLEGLGQDQLTNAPWVAGLSVAFLASIAALNPPLETIAALGGSTGGALLIYVAPALMSLQLQSSQPGPGTAARWALILAGAGVGTLGTVEALLKLGIGV